MILDQTGSGFSDFGPDPQYLPGASLVRICSQLLFSASVLSCYFVCMHEFSHLREQSSLVSTLASMCVDEHIVVCISISQNDAEIEPVSASVMLCPHALPHSMNDAVKKKNDCLVTPLTCKVNTVLHPLIWWRLWPRPDLEKFTALT